MKIFVISMLGSDERRANIISQFLRVGQDFEFFDAVDGRKNEHPLLLKYARKKTLTYKGYDMSPGELGCFASHYLLWEKCVDIGEPIVVIEDDAELEASFTKNSVSELSSLAQFGYVRLFVNGRKRPYVKIDQFGKFDVVEYKRGPGATRAYLIAPAAAAKFIEAAQEWYLPVDDYMDQFWLNKVACRGIMPGIVKNETDHGSYIVRNKSKKKNHITRELYSLKMMIQRNWYLFRHGPKS